MTSPAPASLNYENTSACPASVLRSGSKFTASPLRRRRPISGLCRARSIPGSVRKTDGEILLSDTSTLKERIKQLMVEPHAQTTLIRSPTTNRLRPRQPGLDPSMRCNRRRARQEISEDSRSATTAQRVLRQRQHDGRFSGRPPAAAPSIQPSLLAVATRVTTWHLVKAARSLGFTNRILFFHWLAWGLGSKQDQRLKERRAPN